MPPKKTNQDLLIIKLKRQSSTYIVDCNQKDSIGDLKKKLAHMINSTNGLKLDDRPVSLAEMDALIDKDNIPVPNIGMNDSDSESDGEINADDNDIKAKDSNSNSTELNDDSCVQVSEDDITLGTFTDPSDVYTSSVEVIDLPDSTKLNKMNNQDLGSLAFKIKSEEFKIYKPQYD